jgi:hypothetical protein
MTIATRLVTALLSSTLAVAALAAPGHASQLIARDATSVHLAVDGDGRALVSYRSRGTTRHVLAWGALNAIAPTRARDQVEFHVDYAGGLGFERTSGLEVVPQHLPAGTRAARVARDGVSRL